MCGYLSKNYLHELGAGNAVRRERERSMRAVIWNKPFRVGNLTGGEPKFCASLLSAEPRTARRRSVAVEGHRVQAGRYGMVDDDDLVAALCPSDGLERAD